MKFSRRGQPETGHTDQDGSRQVPEVREVDDTHAEDVNLQQVIATFFN